MAKISKGINFITRLLFGILLIALSLRQMHDNNNLIKSGQDTITKCKGLFEKLNIYDLNKIYSLVPAFISTMNYILLLTGVLSIIRIMDNLFFMNFVILVQLLLVHNIFLDHSSKCYLMASAYVGIYGVFLWLRN